MAAPNLLLLAPVLFLALWVIWRAVTLPGWVRERPICGLCGYEFTGTSRCPECGRDVAYAGVATRRLAMRLRGSLPAAAAALLLITVSVGGWAHWWAVRELAKTNYTQYTSTLSLIPTAAPSPLLSIELSKDGLATGKVVHSGTITILLNPSNSSPDSAPVATVQIPSGRARLTDASGRPLGRSRHFDRAAADLLLQGAGLDITDPARQAEAEHLVAWIQDSLAEEPMFGTGRKKSLEHTALMVSRGTYSSRGADPPKIFGMARDLALVSGTFVASAVLYLMLLAAIIWRRRRLFTPRETAPGGNRRPGPDPSPVLSAG